MALNFSINDIVEDVTRGTEGFREKFLILEIFEKRSKTGWDITYYKVLSFRTSKISAVDYRVAEGRCKLIPQ